MNVSPAAGRRARTIHFIVARSRAGWAVTADADRLCDYSTVEAARACAETLARRTRKAGRTADVVDLSQPRRA